MFLVADWPGQQLLPSHGGQVHTGSRMATLVPRAEFGGGCAWPGSVHDVRTEGLGVAAAAGASCQGPDLGFMLEGSSHL